MALLTNLIRYYITVYTYIKPVQIEFSCDGLLELRLVERLGSHLRDGSHDTLGDASAEDAGTGETHSLAGLTFTTMLARGSSLALRTARPFATLAERRYVPCGCSSFLHVL